MQWNGEFEGYAVNFLSREFWRVRHTHDWEDAVAEAALVFAKVSRRYPKAAPAHLMALYKTALERRFHNLALADTRRRKVAVESMKAEWEPIGVTDNDGFLMVMLRQAPSEIRTVLSVFLSAPTELIEATLSTWRDNGSSAMLNRLIGRPEHEDTLGALRAYFSE